MIHHRIIPDSIRIAFENQVSSVRIDEGRTNPIRGQVSAAVTVVVLLLIVVVVVVVVHFNLSARREISNYDVASNVRPSFLGRIRHSQSSCMFDGLLALLDRCAGGRGRGERERKRERWIVRLVCYTRPQSSSPVIAKDDESSPPR